jgi:hypothetical protein
MAVKQGLVVLSSIALIFLSVSCKTNTVDAPQTTGLDTTSNNFIWKTFTFGDNNSYSKIYDVAIRNDSDIWAVGRIAEGDSLYNVAHWDGKTWELKWLTTNRQKAFFFPYIGVVITGSDNIFVTNGGWGFWINGDTLTLDQGMGALILAPVKKMFARSGKDIYAVGEMGTVVHFDGSKWAMADYFLSGHLSDVWGGEDGITVWAGGAGKLYRYDGIRWRQIWEPSPNPTPKPYNTSISGIFATKYDLWITGDQGIDRWDLDGDTSSVNKPLLTPSRPASAIRGTPTGGSIAVLYENAVIWHYNGCRWQEVHPATTGRNLYSVAVSGHLVAAVGEDIITHRAIIYLVLTEKVCV